MGKQHKKIIKRSRRKLYLKRKNEQVKASIALKGSSPAKKVTKTEDKPAAKKAATKKVAAKKAATKTATKKTAAKKVSSKKVTAKKAAAKKAPAAKDEAVAKKVVAKKATAKKVAAKKAEVKAEEPAKTPTAAKKTTTKKTATKKTVAKKATSKKVSAKATEAEADVVVEKKPKKKSSTPSIAVGEQVMATVVPYEREKNNHYMDKEQLAHFSQKLADWKQQLMEEVDRTVGHMKDDATNFPDPNDRATQEEEFSLELRTRDRERKLIKKINEAQKRIEELEYGYCETCGVEIGVGRLEARPTAELCIDCKTLEEIREKQIA